METFFIICIVATPIFWAIAVGLAVRKGTQVVNKVIKKHSGFFDGL